MAIFSLLLAPAFVLAPVDDKADARCAVAILQMNDAIADPEKKAQLTSGLMYYLGKLAAVHTLPETKALLETARIEVTASKIGEIATQCGQEIIDMGVALDG
jgi:hypothetical protein